MSTSNHYSFMILKMWYWNWNEDESISQVVLLNNDETLDDCVTDVVMKFALTHNISRPKHMVDNLSTLPQMFLDDLLNLNLSEQKPCKYTNQTSMNVLSYTNTKGDGHIEVMGLYTNPYELLDVNNNLLLE